MMYTVALQLGVRSGMDRQTSMGTSVLLGIQHAQPMLQVLALLTHVVMRLSTMVAPFIGLVRLLLWELHCHFCGQSLRKSPRQCAQDCMLEVMGVTPSEFMCLILVGCFQ